MFCGFAIANPHSLDVHVTLAPGYDEWREGAVQTLADCGKILEGRETFEIHLDPPPSNWSTLRLWKEEDRRWQGSVTSLRRS